MFLFALRVETGTRRSPVSISPIEVQGLLCMHLAPFAATVHRRRLSATASERETAAAASCRLDHDL